VRRGEPGPAAVLPIPDDIWNGVRRDDVHDTYRDVFRNTDAMTRAWITSITEGRPVRPDFSDGLAVQRVVDAALDSAANGGRHVPVVTESVLAGG
jgi:predicted dehydrogenase